ncbi:MAG: DUF1540 domain-containing protein [Alicyclobacillaceae bacterium]|jgi:hypothetical protein|uniref:DUF1540 domain-containing protein n=1 Tax=Alicyclobacillus sp. SP_1 TaxID=2942475 RepID=UPI0021586570|nr:DUF1540 domain-containing protein [Alicyclobacillus sp. SP_1]MCY0888997.1 DUF1540 domain-containing protein [Alicyclobacillaceae bacterium]MCY0896708.1 DUF1540 domain-containing protein [Alicyclobacillaceae bacterium]
MPKGVRCLVEECKYHERDACMAPEIEIGTTGNAIVGTSRGTMCATYVYRDFKPQDKTHSPDALLPIH